MLVAERCPLCRRPGPAPCAACAAQVSSPLGTPTVPVAFAFDGAGRRLVLALKYANGRSLVRPIARAMARLVSRGSIDVVTWAPTSRARRKERGYDQAELLARAVSWQLGVPCRRLLDRADQSPPQTGRTRTERLGGPVFRARRRVRGRVLLVDDVVTTGATLRNAQQALRAAGAVDVRCIAAAATPRMP
jgi:predicted amidophosphoribosyltransferase